MTKTMTNQKWDTMTRQGGITSYYLNDKLVQVIVPAFDEIEAIKATMINRGDIEEVRDYTFRIFEIIMSKYIGKLVLIDYIGFNNFSYVDERFQFIITDDKYLFGNYKVDSETSMDINFLIDKWQVADILFNIDEIERTITVLLIDDSEIIIDLNEAD
ncbi:MAG: hypothetical protein BWY15_01601 [Firmicutes bacterium ADurb.Bin193]|nr:MAG: hypothetical protein BWY15_01601 [Firmicutes bacterium ADurb.Bin193]